MTFSIVGRDGDAFGVAVASKFLAVGAYVPAARAAVGALATQAAANLGYKAAGLALLGDARPAADVVAALTGPDAERAHRQVGAVDRDAGSASFTGESCIPWAGHLTGPGYAVQGNCLAGPQVVEAAEAAFRDSSATLTRRLLDALRAGDEAGGDKRGRQSAAVYVVSPGAGYGGTDDVLHDLRCDDSPAPVPELFRLLDLHDLYFGRPDPATLIPWADVAEEVAGHLERLGYTGDGAYEEWLGTENYEERHVPGSIDPLVLDRLRAQR